MHIEFRELNLLNILTFRPLSIPSARRHLLNPSSLPSSLSQTHKRRPPRIPKPRSRHLGRGLALATPKRRLLPKWRHRNALQLRAKVAEGVVEGVVGGVGTVMEVAE